MPNDRAAQLDLAGVQFAGLHDYFGLWAVEESRFWQVFERARQTDLAAHVARMQQHGQPQPQAAATVIAPGPTGGEQGDNVAVIQASGTLMKRESSLEESTSTIRLRRELREAARDQSVGGVILIMDSPGGSASGTADLAREVRDVAARKPVWGFVEDLSASAAYWVLSQTDRIDANHRTALVGSIGTIIALYDLSQRAESEGIEALVFATGEYKGTGFPGSRVTDAQRQYLQNLVDQTQRSFSGEVASGRGLSAADVDRLADGRVYLADEAQAAGLIDGIQSFDQTLEDMRRLITNRNPTGGAQQKERTMTTPATPEPSNAIATAAADAAQQATDTVRQAAQPAEADQHNTASLAAAAPSTGSESAGSATASDGEPPAAQADDANADADADDNTADASPDAGDGPDEAGEPGGNDAAPDDAGTGDETQHGADPRDQDGQAFLDAFGQQGAVWFAQGKTFQQAEQLYRQQLQEENAALKQKLGQEDGPAGGADPVEFSAEGGNTNQHADKLRTSLGDNLARFAAGIKLPTD